MRVLVLGGLGVNGVWVTREAIKRNHEVTVIDVREDFSLMSSEEQSKIDFQQLDARQIDDVEALMRSRRTEGVIHMAAAVGSKTAEPDPYRTYELNAGLTVSLLEAARRAEVKRFVFTSSRAVYGPLTGAYQAPHYEAVPEDHPLRPSRLYDVCKVTSEQVGNEFAKSFPMQFVALRYAMIFGPGKTLRHGKFGTVSSMIEAAVAGQPFRVEQGGDQLDDMIFAEDVGEGTLLALEAQQLNHTAYNISNGVGHTLKDVAQAIREEIPGADISVGDGLNFLGFQGNYSGVLDPSRAMADLGFLPKTDIRQDVRRYIKALKHTNRPASAMTASD